METKNTIFKFIEKVFLMWSGMIVLLGIICFFVGDQGQGVSSIFSLGKEGIPLTVLVQWFLFSICINLLNQLFEMDSVVKAISMSKRTTVLLLSIFVVTVFFIYTFQWFPMDSKIAWGLFIICFVVSTLLSLLLTAMKEKSENQKMEAALKAFQEKIKEGIEND